MTGSASPCQSYQIAVVLASVHDGSRRIKRRIDGRVREKFLVVHGRLEDGPILHVSVDEGRVSHPIRTTARLTTRRVSMATEGKSVRLQRRRAFGAKHGNPVNAITRGRFFRYDSYGDGTFESPVLVVVFGWRGRWLWLCGDADEISERGWQKLLFGSVARKKVDGA